MRNSYTTNSYESPPTFDDHSSNSSDTPHPLQFPPQIHRNQSQSPPPHHPLSPYTHSPLHSSTIMPLYNNTHDHDNKTDNKIEILPSNSNNNSSMVKTQNLAIKLSTIHSSTDTSISSRTHIFENVSCGNYVFDIDYYIKNNSDESNTLIISILQKQRSRGTKRKGCNLNDNSQFNKKRRLNNSKSQSYSINNGSSDPFNTNDSINNYNNLEIVFKISIGVCHNDTNPLLKEFRCKFGQNNDSDELLSSAWDMDSDCENIPFLNAFKIESFDDLSNRIELCVNDSINSDNKIPKKQCIYIQCEIQIVGSNNNNSNGFNNTNFNNINQESYRHIFSDRAVTKFVGLKNEGATCYMNSMLQTLYHIASLRRNVYKIPVGHEAKQKKIKKEKELQIKNENKKQQQKINGNHIGNGNDNTDANAMDVCDDENDNDNDDIGTSDDDDDYNSSNKKKKKHIKPPISLELQRLFYQLQTGAESNHCDEYSISKKKIKNDMNDNDNDDGNNSDCSVFELKSDDEFNPNNITNDDDVDMSQSMDLPSNNSSSDLQYWSSSYGKAASTSNLIKSFGWSGSDAFVQHDVQEFLRVLMDKIEAKVKCTPAEKIVEKLFSGEYQSYVSCKNVSYESVRNENFQDIQLTIPKNNNNKSTYSRYSSNDNSSSPDIYDCIRKFIEPEALDGDNQYYANDELKKQDADKGLRFKRFPPVLFLQLCRFEIDHYQHTSKINDPVIFYEDIDLNPFVYVEKKKNDDEKKESKDDKCEDIEYNRSQPNEYYNHLPSNSSGEFSYQLFSVLVHSGSTYGGHYFAYINPSGNKWYKFDDENVTIVDSEEATRKQFGGSSRQSAYMLVYIQKKYAKQILGEVNENDIPFGLRQYFSAEKEKTQRMRLEEIENSKKCPISYMNGHGMIYEEVNNMDHDKMGEYNDNNNDIYVNVLDMGMKTLLKRKQIYKDIQFKSIYKDWSDEYNITTENLLVYNYTERKNKTLRTNRQIKLNFNEDIKNDDTSKYSGDDIKRHKIKTGITKDKYAKNIYDRIGNIMEKKRMFILFDKSKIQCLGQKSTNSESKTILMALKYFDIFEQKLYFVDWILVKTDSIKFSDIMQYIEQKLTVETKDKRCYFDVLYNYCNEMNDWENKTGQNCDRFIMCEEEAVLKNKGSRDDSVCKTNNIDLNSVITSDYFDGDIFIFQFNAYHPYWNSLKAGITNIPNIKQLMNKNNGNGPGGKSLSLKIKLIQYEFQRKGVYWYDNVANFLESQLTMTNIELKVRENTGWKTRWIHALALQYKNDNNIPIEQDLDKDLRKKLFKSKHKWCVEKKINFGMIRRKLGAYYNINPNHIEIWLPQNTYGYSDKWDYGSKGRGKCSSKLSNLLSDGRHEWNEQCSLKFEIQTYKMTDFDQMTSYDQSTGNSYGYINNDVKFSKRIKELAMFNLEIIAPNKATSGCGNMTMSFCKNWTAQTLVNGIMKEVIENPIFGYTFFSKIVEYIRDNEIDSADKYIDDISVLKNLTADRFLICDEDDKRLPTEYYMNKEYKMPDSFSQIKYTDFRVQFLAKNDPLVLNKNKKSENKIDIDYNDSDNEMDVDHDNKGDKTEWITKGIWVYICRVNSYGAKKYTRKVRIVIEKGESFKDIILKYLKPFLQIDYGALTSSKQSSLSIDMKDDKKDNDNDKENENNKENENGKSNDDILFEQIFETHKFCIKGTQTKVTKRILENPGVMDDIKHKMYFVIQLPTQKKRSMNSYDKPLKIAD